MQYISSNKKTVQILVQECLNYGVKHAVISPGSRNAPLIIAFDNNPEITCYSIPDERSAAFYALGMARQLNEPVAIICTSGTAVLNYAPAITEAYYQEIPLIAITADRPPYLIDQEDGQTIRQDNIFSNHIKYSCTLPIEEDQAAISLGSELITNSLEEALIFPQGPVHINIPFEEPLYESETIDYGNNPKAIKHNTTLHSESYKEIRKAWDNSSKVMLLVGVNQANTNINRLITNFANSKNCVVFAPATANIHGANTFNTIESLFYSAIVEDRVEFTPDLLFTFGGPIVSKAAKQFLRKHKPKFHFDIDVNPEKIDTYKALTHKITCSTEVFIESIQNELELKPQTYVNTWSQRNETINLATKTYIDSVKWCDLTVFNSILNSFQGSIDLHLANSTPVRYAELFNKKANINYYCNRGTSGIDGSTSTTAGAALVSNKPTFLITGDISFFYDSNAFWNNHVPDNLKVILINNGGGNIFKVIRGPENTGQLESLFVTQQQAKAEKLCEAFNVKYSLCNSSNDFSNKLSELYQSNSCAVLEVFTPSDYSAKVYRELFGVIKDSVILDQL